MRRRLGADGLGRDLLGSAVLDVVHQILSDVHELVHVVLLGALDTRVDVVLRVSDDGADAVGILPAGAHDTKQTEALLLALLLGEESEESLAVGRSLRSGSARARSRQTSGGDGSQSGGGRGGGSLRLGLLGGRSGGGGDNGVALGDGGVDLVNAVDVLGLGAGQTLLGPGEAVEELALAGLEALAGVEADGQLEALLGAEQVLQQSQRSLAVVSGGRGGGAGGGLDLGGDGDGVETGGGEEQAEVGNGGGGESGNREDRGELHCESECVLVSEERFGGGVWGGYIYFGEASASLCLALCFCV